MTISQIGGGSCSNLGVFNHDSSVESTYLYQKPGAIRVGCYSVNGTYQITLDLDSSTKTMCIVGRGCSTLSNGTMYHPVIGDDNSMSGNPTIFTFKFKEPFTNTIPVGYSPLN